MLKLILGAALTVAFGAAAGYSATTNPQIEGTGNPTRVKQAPGLLIAPTNPNPPQQPKTPSSPPSCDVSKGQAPVCPPSQCQDGCGIYG